MTDNNEGRPDGNGTASASNPNDATRITDTAGPPGFSFRDWVNGKEQKAKQPHSLVQRLTNRGHGDLLRQPANNDSAAAEAVAQWDEWFNGKPATRPAITPAPIDTTDRDRAYAAATLDTLAREVAMLAADSRVRNDTLNRHALRCYRLADAAGVDRQIVTDAMTAAGRQCGLDDREIAATLRSAVTGADKYGPADIPDGDTIGPASTIDPPTNGAAPLPATGRRLGTPTSRRCWPEAYPTRPRRPSCAAPTAKRSSTPASETSSTATPRTAKRWSRSPPPPSTWPPPAPCCSSTSTTTAPSRQRSGC